MSRDTSAAAISTALGCVPYGFKYLLVTPDGQPHDRAAFVTAVPNWREGES